MTTRVLITTLVTRGDNPSISTTVVEYEDYSEALHAAKQLNSKVHPLDSAYNYLKRSAEII
jgi:hypothetical protein